MFGFLQTAIFIEVKGIASLVQAVRLNGVESNDLLDLRQALA